MWTHYSKLAQTCVFQRTASWACSPLEEKARPNGEKSPPSITSPEEFDIPRLFLCFMSCKPKLNKRDFRLYTVVVVMHTNALESTSRLFLSTMRQ